jgi:phosphatidylinositol alpha-mannosyltransferase
LYVGRLEKKKGVHFLIRAFQKIRLKNARLLIVGDGPLRSELLSSIRKLRLSDRIYLKGQISKDELYRTYSQAHIFILPSEFEAHSMALTEAMAFGLVPIVTNVGGNKYVITDRKDGFLIRYPPNVNEISNILFRLIQNHDLMLNMSKHATERARSFDMVKVLKDLEKVYQTV